MPRPSPRHPPRPPPGPWVLAVGLGLLHALVEHAIRLLDAPYAKIYKVEDDLLVPLACSSNLPGPNCTSVGRYEAPLSWQAVDTRMPAVLEDYDSWPNNRQAYEPLLLHAVADFPIISGERCLGVLSVGRDQPNLPFTPDQVQVGDLFAQIAALVIENAQMSEEMHELSVRDALTGLHNRRYLFEVMPREISRAMRDGYPISIVMLDIDYFKHINDAYGHSAGDEALKALANQFKSMVRSSDILCRYGGDEHTILMYDTTPEIALARAEQWRQSIEKMNITADDKLLHITISVGVATFPVHGQTIDDVVRCADEALYYSKNTGRNRVTLYQQEKIKSQVNQALEP